MISAVQQHDGHAPKPLIRSAYILISPVGSLSDARWTLDSLNAAVLERTGKDVWELERRAGWKVAEILVRVRYDDGAMETVDELDFLKLIGRVQESEGEA